MSTKFRVVVVLFLLIAAPGCLARKVVALPLRVTGAAVSVVPGIGGAGHVVMDGAAEVVD